MSDRWHLLDINVSSKSQHYEIDSFSEEDDLDFDDDCIYEKKQEMLALHPCEKILKRRASKNRSIECRPTQKARKTEVKNREEKVAAENRSIIICAPLRKNCCCLNCLHEIKYSEAKKIYDEWNIDKFHRFKKMRDFLSSKKQPHEVLYSHLLGGNYYVLNIEINGRNMYLCPQAFRKLVHMGQDKLQQLAQADDTIDHSTLKLQIEEEKIFKKNLVASYMNDIIIPQCVNDESYPTQFLRCEIYSTLKSAYQGYRDYLNTKFGQNSKFSYCSSSLFKSVNSESFNHILWGLSTHCPTCALFKGRLVTLKNEQKGLENVPRNDQRVIDNEKSFRDFENDLKNHNDLANQIRAYSDHFAHRARSSEWKEISWVFDYMAQKQLPQPKELERVSILEIWRKSYGFGGMQRVALRFAGLFDYRTKESSYTLHTHNTESANTVLTILYLKLKDFLIHSPKTLTLTMDNKQTGKSYLLIAFQELLVCHWKIIDHFRSIFLIKGHSVSDQDISNEPTTQIFYSNSNWLLQPSDVCDLINETAKRAHASLLSSFFDWSKSLFYDEKRIAGGLGLSQIWETTQDGTFLYDTPNSKPRGPFKILTDTPKFPPPFEETPKLSDKTIEHLGTFQQNYQHQLTTEQNRYLEELIRDNGSLGKVEVPNFEILKKESIQVDTTIPISPITQIIAPMKETNDESNAKIIEAIMVVKHKLQRPKDGQDHYIFQLNNSLDWKKADQFEPHLLDRYKLLHPTINFQKIPPLKKREAVVVHLGELTWNEQEETYTIAATFKNDSVIHQNKREDFLDYDKYGDEIKTDLFSKWELKHPEKAILFRENKKPKK